MAQQAIELIEELTNEDANEPASSLLTGLELTDAELDGIKGGPLCHGVSVLAWAKVDGVSPSSNHNETMTDDEDRDAETPQLTDLVVSDGQSGKVQGGDNNHGTHVAGTIGAIGAGGTGKVQMRDF